MLRRGFLALAGVWLIWRAVVSKAVLPPPPQIEARWLPSRQYPTLKISGAPLEMVRWARLVKEDPNDLYMLERFESDWESGVLQSSYTLSSSSLHSFQRELRTLRRLGIEVAGEMPQTFRLPRQLS